MVLKAPPLMVTSEQLDEFVNAIRDVVELAQTSPALWTEALGTRSQYLSGIRCDSLTGKRTNGIRRRVIRMSRKAGR
jgi:hypothetical protein